jgi:hypothetical protein
MIFNVQYSKEEYEKKVRELTKDYASIERSQALFEQECLKYPRRYAFMDKVEHSTGNYLTQCKNVYAGFDCDESEESKFVQIGLQLKDVLDGSAIGMGELIYEAVGGGWTNHSLFFGFCFPISFAQYCLFCHNSDYLFGCVSMKKNQYCILNKQYGKEEYDAIVPRIIDHMRQGGEWGEFFPISLSPFGYNETVAQIYFPLTREEAREKNYQWQDGMPHTSGKETMSMSGQVGLLNDIDATKEIFACAVCRRNYKIIAPELTFYRNMHLPLPRLCSQCRYERRMKLHGTSHVLHRLRCGCAGAKSANGVYANTASHPHGSTPCPAEFETTFSQDCPEIVYCGECYQTEVV